MISREESDLLFEQLDTDGNGSLNFIEAKAGSKKLKAAGLNTAIQTFWAVADADGDKNLTKEEFHAGMCNALKDPEALTEMFETLRVDSGASASSSKAAAAKTSEGTLLFELLDLNRDGRLSRMEIARGLKTLVKAGVPVGVTADAFFKAADSDGDAKVNLAEFLAIFAELPVPVKSQGRPKKRFVPSFELVEDKATAPRQPLAASVPPRAPAAAEEASSGSRSALADASTGATAPAATTAGSDDAVSGKSSGSWREAVASLEANGLVYTAALPGTFNATKHVPVVSFKAEDGIYTCTVSVPHGMAADHFIEYIWAKNEAGEVLAGVKLTADDKPELNLVVPAGIESITAFEACNLHGVWKSDPVLHHTKRA